MNPNISDGPQLERGYTRIANELLEAIAKYPLTGGEMRLLMAVIRSTYGWGRKEAVLYIAELAQMTDLSPRHAKRLLQRLARDRVLLKKAISRMRVVMGMNKHFSTWRLRRIPKGADVPRAGREVSP
jgi:phage replication O-like protein O